jgi:hypothetical protein
MSVQHYGGPNWVQEYLVTKRILRKEYTLWDVDSSCRLAAARHSSRGGRCIPGFVAVLWFSAAAPATTLDNIQLIFRER